MASRRLALGLALPLALQLAAAPAFAHEGDGLAPAPAVPPPPPPTSPVGAAPARISPWPWVMAGVGVLTLGAGIYVVHRADSENSVPACTTSPIGPASCPYSKPSTWQGWGLVAIGAQLAIAGAAWRVYEVRHARKSVSVIAGLGTLQLAGTF
jgi:hypothetical protein